MALSPEDDEEQDPTIQLWLYYFLSQHHMRFDQLDKSFEYINKAIEHTPTVVELYTCKARIFQKAGNFMQAMECAEHGRELDQADRYLNALSSKYLFKVDDVKRANVTMAMFSKENDAGNLNVHEM